MLIDGLIALFSWRSASMRTFSDPFIILLSRLLLLSSTTSYHHLCWAQQPVNNGNEDDGGGGELLDCSFPDATDLTGDGTLLLRSIIHPGAGTVTVELEYAGEGWLGLAFSNSDRMVPNTAVLGLPGGSGGDGAATGTVQKYDLSSRSREGVAAFTESPTLTDASIAQSDGVTTLRFTKPLAEASEPTVVVGDNRVNWAYGASNALDGGGHGASNRGSAVVAVGACRARAPSVAPGVAPTRAPATGAPFAPAAPNAPLDCSLLRDGVQAVDVWGDGRLVVRGTVHPAKLTATVRMEYAGQAWLGFAFSETDRMVPNTGAVIGLPAAGGGGSVQKYDLSVRDIVGVEPLRPTGLQTLTDASITQQDGYTVLEFTQHLSEPEQAVEVFAGANQFIWAVGASNELANHVAKGAGVITLGVCSANDDAGPVVPSPTAMTPVAPSPNSSGNMEGSPARETNSLIMAVLLLCLFTEFCTLRICV